MRPRDRREYWRRRHAKLQATSPEYRKRKSDTAAKWVRTQRAKQKEMAALVNADADELIDTLMTGCISTEDIVNGKGKGHHSGRRGKGIALGQTFDRRAAYARRQKAPA